MNLNIPIKASGSTLSADEFNQTVAAVNSKADVSLLQNFLTLTGATNTFQLKGNYLTGVTWSIINDKPSFFSGSYSDLVGKPVLFSGAYSDLTGRPNLFSGSYADLTSKPTLFSGAYADLTGRPTIPSISGLASTIYVDNKVADLVASAPETLNTLAELAAALGSDPNFATTVANQIGLKADTTSVYTKIQIDSKAFLTGVAYTQVTGKPTLFSGSYSDLTSKPDLTVKADLVSGKVPVAQLPDATLNAQQFETLPDGSIGIKTSYLQSLGLGGTGTTTPTLAAPSGFNISGATSSSLTLNWSPVANATSYQVERANNAGYTGSTIVFTGSTLTYINTGLTANTNYFYRVKAKAANYNDSAYVTVTGATTEPSANYMPSFTGLDMFDPDFYKENDTDASEIESGIYQLSRPNSGFNVRTSGVHMVDGREISMKYFVDGNAYAMIGVRNEYVNYGLVVDPDNVIVTVENTTTVDVDLTNIKNGDFLICRKNGNNLEFFKSTDGIERVSIAPDIEIEFNQYNEFIASIFTWDNRASAKIYYPQLK